MRVLVPTPDGVEYVRRYLEPLLQPAEQALSWLSDYDRTVVSRFLELFLSLKERSAAETPPPGHDRPREEYLPTLLM